MAVKRIRLKELLIEPFSYNIFKNRYIWFGFLIGLPIPLICILPQFISNARINGIINTHNWCTTNPLHWLYFLFPFIFAFIFGCLGTFKIMKEVESDSYRMLYKIRMKDIKGQKD